MNEQEFIESLHKNTQNAPAHDAVPAPAAPTNQAHVESLNADRNTPPDARPHSEPETLPSAEDLDAVVAERQIAEATDAN